MRIILIIANSFAAQIALKAFLARHHQHVVKVFVLTQVRGSRAERARKLIEFAKTKSLRFLWLKFVETILYPVWKDCAAAMETSAALEQKYSLKKLFKIWNIPTETLSDINSPEAKEMIRAAAPDLLISAYGTQVFDEEVIALAPHAINIHGAILPEYRGSATYFWTLANQERKAGVTVHIMSAQLDQGDILLQKFLQVPDGISVYGLHYRLSRLAAQALLEVTDKLIRGEPLAPQKQSGNKGRYRIPSRDDVRKFRGRMITLKDFFSLR